MTESKLMFGKKEFARRLKISVKKVGKLLKAGMPHTRDESGMYVFSEDIIKQWFEERMKSRPTGKK